MRKRNLVIITKRECEELQKRGFSFNRGELHHTIGNGRKKTYYATESEALMRELKTLRSY